MSVFDKIGRLVYDASTSLCATHKVKGRRTFVYIGGQLTNSRAKIERGEVIADAEREAAQVAAYFDFCGNNSMYAHRKSMLTARLAPGRSTQAF